MIFLTSCPSPSFGWKTHTPVNLQAMCLSTRPKTHTLGSTTGPLKFFWAQKKEVLHKEFGTAEALRISRLCPCGRDFPIPILFGWELERSILFDLGGVWIRSGTMNCTKKMVKKTEANHPRFCFLFEAMAPKEIGRLEYSKWSMLSHKWWFLKNLEYYAPLSLWLQHSHTLTSADMIPPTIDCSYIHGILAAGTTHSNTTTQRLPSLSCFSQRWSFLEWLKLQRILWSWRWLPPKF